MNYLRLGNRRQGEAKDRKAKNHAALGKGPDTLGFPFNFHLSQRLDSEQTRTYSEQLLVHQVRK